MSTNHWSGHALRERLKELHRRGEPQAGPLRDGRREVFGVVSQNPVGAARDSGQEYRNVRGMANQLARRNNLRSARVWDDLGLRQGDETRIVVQDAARLGGITPSQASQKVFFNFVTHRFSQNQPANSSCAQ
jgi:hypothetical protein